ncbi:DNA repair exonuclease [Candidatus Woesearchaeota archaeon]|nr:DNA repair exonuclease [Candidatus Woesearchaeota archaeon]
MKFAHMSDIHIGGWKEPKLRDLNIKSFVKAVDIILQENVDFVLLCGDLFNTAIPDIDSIKLAVEQLKRIHDASIPVYFIAGSHDFSPSGKTMLDIIDRAGLGINVAKGSVVDGKLKLHFTVDSKTGVKITGIIGKKGGLDKYYYEDLLRESLENERGNKIFLFHSAINELKPKDLEEMDAMEVSFLPKGFNYYAGGHVHVVDRQDLDGYQNIVFPGPTFPNNFSELEKLKHGSFCIVEDFRVKHVSLPLHQVVSLTIDCNSKTPGQVEDYCFSQIKNVENAIVLLRFKGVLCSGKPSDILMQKIFEYLEQQGAYAMLKNTSKLSSKEFEEIKISSENVDVLEEKIIQENTKQHQLTSVEKQIGLVKKLAQVLSVEKEEGEKIADFEKRILDDSVKSINSLISLDTEHQ